MMSDDCKEVRSKARINGDPSVVQFFKGCDVAIKERRVDVFEIGSKIVTRETKPRMRHPLKALIAIDTKEVEEMTFWGKDLNNFETWCVVF